MGFIEPPKIFSLSPRRCAGGRKVVDFDGLKDRLLLEKIAVMVVTSSADRPQIYSERVGNLSGFNRTKLKQDGGSSARLIQDLLQADMLHVSKIDDLRQNHQQHVPHELV